MRTSSRKPLQQMPHPPDSEHGIFLFLAAALVVVLISSVLFLGYFTIQSKRVNSLLRKNADLICQEIAYAPMLPERAWNTFQELVEKVDLKHGHITNARLVLPLMTNRVDNPPFCRTLDNQSLLTGSCGKGVNCTLETSVCDNNEHITSNYPSTIWDTARDIGSAVACELTAKMNPLGGGLFSDFFEDKVNETRVVWYRPLFYAQDEEFISTSETDNEYVWPNFPYGLTLIISPHMTTYGGLRRFQFKDADETLSFPNNFLASHDPLKQGLSSFTYSNPPLRYHQKTSLGDYIDIPPSDVLDTQVLDNQKYDKALGEREEMLVACRNPASLIRNIISATFVELASRDIRLRTSTDILLTGTAHRIWNSAVYPSNPLFFGGPTASFPSPPMPNSPILLVEKGQDLRAHAYQLPYVSFYGGVATPETYYSGELPFEPDNYIETAPLLGRAEIHHEDGYPDSFDLKQGWILPFATKTGEGKYNPLYARTLGQAEGEITENDRRLNALRNMITSQLRWCHHLYASEGGISLDPLSYLRTESYEEENEALEPPSYLNDSYLRESYPANDPWGPRCNPWIGCTPQNFNANAFELVMSLGTIQQCPFEMTFSEDEADPLIKHLRNSVSQPTCTKPPRRKEDEVDMPTKDLYPDFEGVFYFLHHPPPYQPIDGLELRNNARNDTPI
ncbi:MAG: hypothetical protein KDD55_11815, partial [Bdellovibrionales bacterium]|nr:hypothetical protein [Bdellovibrionales bacterium]